MKENSLTNRVPFAVAILATALTLAACGGGGGGSNPTPPIGQPSSAPSTKPSTAPGTSPSPTASAAPSPSPSPSLATATGTVVDFAANTPLSGVAVSIAAYTAGAAATQVATTTASGTFAFTAQPGTYLLIIGSNSPTDTTTTLHDKITLVAGANALTWVVPPAEPNVTYTAAQTSGNFRLTALAGNQLSCYTGANSGRTADSLPQLVPDEALTEYATAISQEEAGQSTDTPTPLFNGSTPAQAEGYGVLTSYGFTTSENFTPCSLWTGTTYSYVSGNPPYAYATSASNAWYGAQQTNGNTEYGAQIWTSDPR